MISLGLLLAYLLGAVPFGYLVARARGVDIFQAGSGNIGATNVGRVLGTKYGLFVFAVDFLKGFLPPFVAIQLRGTTDWVAILAGLLAFLGHLFPIYLRFRGGKGVATGAGAVAVLLPVPAGLAIAAWVVTVVSSRAISLASIVAAGTLIAIRLLHATEADDASRTALTVFAAVAGGLVLVRHRSNAVRLWAGTENLLPESGTMRTLQRSLHVLACGLWFGTGVFFTFVVGLGLFQTFGDYAKSEPPEWLPVTRPFTKELGSRIAGAAVSPMFPPYYSIQTGCGLIALATSYGWWRRGGVHKLRFIVFTLALFGAVAGWTTLPQITALRTGRYQEATREAATAEFNRLHTISILVNLATLALVATGTALAGAMPDRKESVP